MPVKLVKIGTSATVGLVDIGLEKLDEMQGWTEPFKKSQDIFRAGAFAFGLANELVLNIVPSDVAESLMDSSLPLLEKSIYEFVQSMTKKGGYSKVVIRKVSEKPAVMPTYRAPGLVSF